MRIRKTLWNGLVFLAVLFLLFMFGANHTLKTVTQFESMPKPPVLKEMQLKSVNLETLSLGKRYTPKSLTENHTIFLKATSNAVAWVVQVNQNTPATPQLIEKLRAAKWAAYVLPSDSQQATHLLFVGPYVHRQEAEQAAEKLKNTFGLAGDVVKFDPLTV